MLSSPPDPSPPPLFLLPSPVLAPLTQYIAGLQHHGMEESQDEAEGQHGGEGGQPAARHGQREEQKDPQGERRLAAEPV